MRVYGTREIRNLGVVGHGDAGKTSLIAAMLYAAGATSRLGRVDEGTAPTDYDEEEIARGISLNLTPAFVEYKGTKVNLIDTPGYAAFIAHARPALRVSELALLVLDAVDGVGVQTEKVWGYTEEFGLPRMIVINKLDKERGDFEAVLREAREAFGRGCLPFSLPIGSESGFRGVIDVVGLKGYEFEMNGKAREIELSAEELERAGKAREELIEMVAESDDGLMERFFEAGTLSDEELLLGIQRAVVGRKLIPVFATSAAGMIGITTLLDGLVRYAPSPADYVGIEGRSGGEGGGSVRVLASDNAPPVGYVFRTVSESFGKITVVKVFSGIIKSDASLYNLNKGANERLGPVHYIQGKHMEKVAEAHAGDIIAVSKLKETATGDTLCDKANPIFIPPVEYPEPAISFAVVPKSRQDEDKLSGAIHKILDEDPQLRYERDEQTKEFLLAGSGQQHIEVVVSQLRRRYGVEVELHLPKVPYRETIKTRVEAQGRHKKQTGGRGQFGDCKCIFEPLPRGAGFEFEDKIFGGAIPQQWRPAVEKGIRDAAAKGYLAGYPVVDFKVQLVDGSYHTVDSDDISFQLAGRKAFRNAIEKANPVLLEPIMNVEVIAPQEFSGDLMGDLNARRGRIQGMDARGNQQVIKAQVPLSEMLNYPPALNSITGARGTYHMEFSHYDEVPPHLAQKIIQQAQEEGRVKREEDE
jgi:elongation factor G